MNAQLTAKQIDDLATLRQLPTPTDTEDTQYAWTVVIERVRCQRDRYAADGQHTPGLDALLQAMEFRDALGAAKYGMRLAPFNGQDPLREAIQEALDLCAYLANEHTERGDLAASMELDLAIHLALRLVVRYQQTRSTLNG